MAPVPPPPPSNIPTLTSEKSNLKPTGIPNTSALLKSIEKGAKLKKTVTNDRSAPAVSNQPNSTAPNKISHSSSTKSSENINSSSAGLGGLLSNGFPALRSTKNSKSETKISRESSAPTLLKAPITKVVENVSDSISRHPEKSAAIAKTGLKFAAPTIVSEAKKQGEKMVNMAKASDFGNHISNQMSFPIADDKNLPVPRKFIGFKKIYLSKNIKIEPKLSKSYSGSLVSEGDIESFIKSLKSKLNKAVDNENFEECLRLKNKLKSFEDIERRIKSGEKICPTELPK